MAKRQTKKAQEDLLEEKILVSKPDHFVKMAFAFLLNVMGILGVAFSTSLSGWGISRKHPSEFQENNKQYSSKGQSCEKDDPQDIY